MPADLVAELVRLLAAAATVAAYAVPTALVCTWATWRFHRNVLPRWRPCSDVRPGVEIFALFLANVAISSMLMAGLELSGFFYAIYGPDFPAPRATGDAANRANALRSLWVAILGTPLLYAAMLAAKSARGSSIRFDVRSWPGGVALGVLAWLAVSPAVLGVHLAVRIVADRLGLPTSEHPFTVLGADNSRFDRVIFGLAVCVAAPFAEELLYRGLLVRWAAGRRSRPWLLTVASVGFATASGEGAWPPVAFAVLLAGGLWVVLNVLPRWRPRFPKRTAAGVWASSAMFAAAHSAVWPTPLPLFVLGLGLGYVAARTGGIAACVVAHGLFNAVSFTYLMKG